MASRPPLRTVTVGGEGEVRVVPDLAHVTFNVETTHADLPRAQRENASRMAAVIARLKELGVRDEDLRTSGYAVRPQHDYNRQGRLIGYQIVNGVHATVRDLPRLSELLDAAVAAGANLVHGVHFDLANRDEALGRAREAAVRDARARAEQYAALAGVRLGPPVTIAEGGHAAQPVFAMRQTFSAMAMDAAATPIEPGEETIRVSVQVSYELWPVGRRGRRRAW